jgi:hypothetical protein
VGAIRDCAASTAKATVAIFISVIRTYRNRRNLITAGFTVIGIDEAALAEKQKFTRSKPGRKPVAMTEAGNGIDLIGPLS